MIVNEYNNTYHRIIKTKPVDIKDNTCIDSSQEVNDKDPKFKVGDHVRISKHKNIFTKWFIRNWSEEVFMIDKVKNTAPWTYVISDLNGEEIIRPFYEKKNYKQQNQQKFRKEKVSKRKGNGLYVKWEGYDNSFNSCIHKSDLI